MLTYIFLASGLFLGWSLGANDASNIFGMAVGSRMIKFRNAAIVGSIFVILGSVLQGSGTTKTLSQLGSVDAIGGAFAVALCSGIIVLIMTKYKLPISTGQAIVGAIVGWCYYTSNPIDYGILIKIASTWVASPILGAVFSALLYLLLRKIIRSWHIHMLKMESIIRVTLIVAGAFAAYSLGANNIANVMGVFVNSFNFSINIGGIVLSSTQVLFLLGSLAISLGMFTYSKKVLDTIGNGILQMTPEIAIAVVLSQALVLFVFSSSALSNVLINLGLPPIPLVPVSSTQVLVGALIGVGLIKGFQELKLNVLGNIMVSWISTPILSGLFTFLSLFFIDRVFGIRVSNNEVSAAITDAEQLRTVNYHFSIDLKTTFIILLIIALVICIVYLATNKLKKKEEVRNQEIIPYTDYLKSLSQIILKKDEFEDMIIEDRKEEKRDGLATFALAVSDQRKQLEDVAETLKTAISKTISSEKNEILKNQLQQLEKRLNVSEDVDEIFRQAETTYADFIEKLATLYPDLTSQEKKLLLLLRISLSSKEMAPILNISPKSVEISRYRLRKKLNIDSNISLMQFVTSM